MHASTSEKQAGYGGGSPGKTHTLNRMTGGTVAGCKGYGAWKSGPLLQPKRSEEWAGRVVYWLWGIFGHRWARLAGSRFHHRLSMSCERWIEDEQHEAPTGIVVEEVAKSDGIDDMIFLVDGLNGKGDHGGGGPVLRKGGCATLELPTATSGCVHLVDLGAYGTTTDDETDVYADGEICVAGEIDGDGSALGSLAGGIAHDPEQVDAGAGEAGEAGGGIAGVEVLGGGCDGVGEEGHGGRGERGRARRAGGGGPGLNWAEGI